MKAILFSLVTLLVFGANAHTTCVSASGKTSVDFYDQSNDSATLNNKVVAVKVRIEDMHWITKNLRPSIGEEVESATFGDAKLWVGSSNMETGEVAITLKEDIYDVVEFKSIPSTLVDGGEGEYTYKATLNVEFSYFETSFPTLAKKWTDIQLTCFNNSGVDDMPTETSEM